MWPEGQAREANGPLPPLSEETLPTGFGRVGYGRHALAFGTYSHGPPILARCAWVTVRADKAITNRLQE